MASAPPSSHFARPDESETALATSPKEDGASTPPAERPWPTPRADKIDRRSEVRFATDQAAILTQVNPITFGITAVRVGDVSRHGMKIYIPHLLYPGAIVHVRLRRNVVVAEVRYCVKFGAGHVSGMAVLDVIPYDGPSTLFNAISSWAVPYPS
jgi:PilZ domain-containing protein